MKKILNLLIAFQKKNLPFETNNNKSSMKTKIFIYITNIIDNLSYYCGIGYQMNNKNIGVYFNDNSQMVKIFNIDKYIIYHYKDFLLNQIKSSVIELPPVNISSNMKKKISFLGHIVDEFMKKDKKKHKKTKKRDSESSQYKKDSEMEGSEDSKNEDIFLKKYKKTSNAYFFVLSNKNIQANFFDKTKIIFICTEPMKITYFNKDDEIQSYPINNNFYEFECDDSEVNKKVKYAIKEICK